MKKIMLLFLAFSFLFTFGSCDEKTATLPPTDGDTPTNGEKPTEDPKTSDSVDYGLHICMPEGRGLKVLQLADIHFGIEGRDWHNDKVDRTKEYITNLINEEQPDLIVCSGDNILSTGTNGLSQFISFMESYRVPWTWVYGNHDGESQAANYRKADLSKYLVNANTEFLIYDHGYIEEGKENRYGNFSIKIYNPTKDKLLGAFIILDSGEHDYSISEYQAITEGQIEWYENEIDSLQEIYAAQDDNEYDIIPTVVYTHIQLPEFKTAYQQAVANAEDAEFIIEQTLSESSIDDIGSGGPTVNTGFFDVLVEKGSTKAYFVGHAHTFYFQVKYKGIILGFGPQTGFSKLFENNEAPRKTYLYTYNDDLTFETKSCDEIVKNKGLYYISTKKSGNASYNREKGVYTFTIEMTLWSRVSLDYYGEESTTEFTPITYNNTTITGEINNSLEADWTTKLYFTNSDESKFLCSSSQVLFYKFTYNPTENTLHIEVVEDYIPLDGEFLVESVNKNSNFTAWKNAGFKVFNSKTGAWCSPGADLFIVVDAEGRIAYAVLHPEDGNGDPESNTYYTHPFYTTDRDYTTNPAISITSDGYDIVVPTGGFAISTKVNSTISILSTIYDANIKEYAEIIKLVLNSDSFSSNLRITYDADKKVVKTAFMDE